MRLSSRRIIPKKSCAWAGQTHFSQLLPPGRKTGGVKVGRCPTFTPPKPLFVGTHIQEQDNCICPVKSPSFS